MVGVREEMMEGVLVICVEAFESITHDNLEERKACVPKVEAMLVVDVDA